MNVKRFVASAAVVAGALGVIPAFGGIAAAQPQSTQPRSDNAGCAAVVTHEDGPMRAPYRLQNEVAREEHGACALIVVIIPH